MIFEIWVRESPWSLKKLRTKFGRSEVSKWSFLEAERADFGDNPHAFIRYEITDEC